jgi:hypothetical protein
MWCCVQAKKAGLAAAVRLWQRVALRAAWRSLRDWMRLMQRLHQVTRARKPAQLARLHPHLQRTCMSSGATQPWDAPHHRGVLRAGCASVHQPIEGFCLLVVEGGHSPEAGAGCTAGGGSQQVAPQADRVSVGILEGEGVRLLAAGSSKVSLWPTCRNVEAST